MEQFPLTPAAFSGEPRLAPPDSAFNWLRQGWAVFIANPGLWLAMSVLILVIFLDPMLALVIAFVLSAVASIFVLSRMRDAMGTNERPIDCSPPALLSASAKQWSRTNASDRSALASGP